MGCVCFSKSFKDEHCGKVSCMFSCQCPPSVKKQGFEIKSKIWLLPEVLRRWNVCHSKLAPVEREYHQTVIMSKDKKITIETKHRKRERKLPSRYKDEILLDYKKDDDEDNDDNDGILINENKGKIVKYNNQVPINDNQVPINNNPNHPAAKIHKTYQKTPLINSLESVLKFPTPSHDHMLNIKQCYVRLERNEAINKMSTTKNFTPGTLINKQQTFTDLFLKNTHANSKSRNVAKKKTGCSTSHSFDIVNYCSRTCEISRNYSQRNELLKLPTKNMILYAALSYGEESHSLNYDANNDLTIFKEDLQGEFGFSDVTETESEFIDKISNDKECNLEIGFVCSLPPELFESTGNTEKDNTSDVTQTPQSSELISTETSHNGSFKTTMPGSGKEKIVNALLPKTENECKWWVVELDSNKYDHLVYYADKRCLSYKVLSKAIFNAEYGSKPVHIALNKQYGGYRFGAYAVPGHKNVVFFGPFDLSEEHGLTAIKLKNEKYIRIDFTTEYQSEKFKSLGYSMSDVKGGADRKVSAVWCYSTGRNGSLKNVAECRGMMSSHRSNAVQEKVNSDDNIYTQAEINIQESDTDDKTSLNVMKQGCITEEIHNEIVFEEVPIKLECLDDYDCHSSVNSLENPNTPSLLEHKLFDPLPQLKKHLSTNDSHSNVQGQKRNLCIDNNLDSREKFKVDKSRSLLKKKEIIKSPPVTKKSPIVIKLAEDKRKRKKQAPRKSMKYRKLISKNINVIPLKKKIADLEEIANLRKSVSTIKRFQTPTTSPVDNSDGSSFFSGENFSRDILSEQSNSSLDTIENASVKKRIIHHSKLPTKIEQAAVPDVLPTHLMLKSLRPGPCPKWALLCTTPGIGYIDVLEFDAETTKLVIPDPRNKMLEHEFQDVMEASAWLNKFFMDRFIIKPFFEMKWIPLIGCVIRKFQPLNPLLFKYSPRRIVIRPSGLDLGTDGQIELMSMERYESKLMRNDLERARRSELSNLMNDLALLVLPSSENKVSERIILRMALLMIEAQKVMDEKLNAKSLKLKKKRLCLNEKLKSIFADIVSHEEKTKAFDLVKYIKCKQYEIPVYYGFRDKSSMYIDMTKKREDAIVKQLAKSKPDYFNYSSESLLRKPPPLTLHVNITTDPKSVEAPNTSEAYSKLPSLQPATGSTSSHQINNRGGVIDISDSSDEEKIIEINSDEEEVVFIPDQLPDRDFEIETNSMNTIVNPVSNSPSKWNKRKLEIPKPIKKLPQPPPKPVFFDLSNNLKKDVGQEDASTSLQKSSSENVPSNVSTSSAHVSPVAMVISPTVFTKQAPIIPMDSLPPRPEFVAVDQQPINSQFLPLETSSRINVFKASSCQLLKPDKGVRSLLKTTLPGASNLNQQKAIKCKNLTPIGKLDPQNNFCQIKGKPILVSKSGKGIQICKLPLTTSSPINSKSDITTITPSNKVSLISPNAINTVNLHHTKPEIKQSVPVISNLSSKSSENINFVSSNESNTVTLYHPSQEISETRTVQFANMKSIQLPQGVSGPKIRPPLPSRPNLRPLLPSHVQSSLLLGSKPYSGEFSQRGKIRVLLPKRTQNKESQ